MLFCAGPASAASKRTGKDGKGTVAYTPLGTLQSMLRSPGEVNTYWISTTSDDHAAIDRVTTRLEDMLGARGNQVTSMEKYVSERDQVAANSSLTTSITVLGLLIVLISMVGLVNAITMGVIERTREIGMLRCVGARGRDVRRIFAVEGITVAVIGWLLGVPLGWAMAHGLITVTSNVADTDLSFVFPPVYLVVTLIGTLVLAVVVLAAPLRRAVRLRPGEALRYT
ncbi:MAG: ABC transporter permease [Solirubrobacteraceae bacterium]|nr:ABC transporter permease [Solirubrobacteraceae bacterium]